MSAPLRRFIALLAVAGLIAAASSSYMHLQLVSDPAYTSFCDIKALFMTVWRPSTRSAENSCGIRQG